MGKTISINQKTLGVFLLLSLIALYIPYFQLPLIAKIAILVIGILLILK